MNPLKTRKKREKNLLGEKKTWRRQQSTILGGNLRFPREIGRGSEIISIGRGGKKGLGHVHGHENVRQSPTTFGWDHGGNAKTINSQTGRLGSTH